MINYIEIRFCNNNLVILLMKVNIVDYDVIVG